MKAVNPASTKIPQYITENTPIIEVVEKYPEVAEILTVDYGFHCIGCFAAEMETIGMGAMGHGMTKKEIKEMLSSLNNLIEKDNK